MDNIVDLQSELICQYDKDIRLTFVNRAYSEWLGLPRETLIGTYIMDLIPAEEREQVIAHLRALTREHPVAITIHSALVSGTNKQIIEWTDRALFDDKGELTGYLGVGRDVTERERRVREMQALQDELKEQRNRLSGVLDTMQDAIISLSLPDGRLLYASNSVEKVFGYPVDRFTNEMGFYLQMVHPDDREKIRQIQQTSLWAGAVELEHRVIWPDGQVRWLQRRAWVNYDQEDKPASLTVVARDITESKKTKLDLEKSERVLKLFVENAPAAIAMLDRDMRYLATSRRWLADYHLGDQDIIGRTHYEIFPDIPDNWKEIHRRCLAGAIEKSEADPFPRADGSLDWVRWEIRPWEDSQGQVGGILLFSEVITDRKEAEEALLRSRWRLEGLHKLDQAISEAYSLEDLVEVALDQLIRLVPCYRTSATILREGTPDSLVFGVQAGESGMVKTRNTYQVGGHYLEALQTQPYILLDTSDPSPRVQELKQQGVRRTLSIGLRHHNTLMGLLNFFALDPDYFTAEIIQTAQEIADQLALGLHKIQLTEELARANVVLEKRVVERTAELETARNRLEAIFNHSGDAILLLDIEQNIQQANYTFNEMFSLANDHIPLLKLSGYFQPGAAQNIETSIKQVADTHKKQHLEASATRPDGTTFEVEISLAPVNRSVNKVTNLVGIIRDITERKQAEQALRDSEERYRKTISTMLEGVTVQNSQGVIQLCNSAAERILGLCYNQLVGLSSIDPRWQAIHVDGSPFPGETHPAMEVLATGQPQSNVIMGVRKPDDTLSWLLVNSQPLFDQHDQLYGAVTTFTDITERRLNEQALRESETRFRILFETSPDTICLINTKGIFVDINPAGLALTGLTREQIIGKSIISLNLFNKPIYQEKVTEGLALTSRGGNRVTEYEINRANGETVIIESLTNPVVLNDEVLQLAVIRDITRRKKAEEELQTLSHRLQLATEAGHIATWDWDAQNDKLYWDDQLLNFYGLTREEFEGTAVGYWDAQLIHPDDLAYVQSEFGAALAGTKPLDIKFRIYPKTGGMRYIKGMADVFRDESGNPTYVVGVNWDITPLKQAEESLKVALEKEKELGELKNRFVSMASHEFRTPLASILATTETLSLYRERMAEVQIDTRLTKIRQQVLHLKGIMDDVLQLGRMQAGKIEVKRVTGNLNQLCRDIIEEFESEARNLGRIQYECLNLHAIANFDEHLMRQVISNLISNALKYSPADKPVIITLVREADKLVLRVRDQGIGIPSDDLKHLFEPFHRASNVGNISGTGLGLNITKQAVELHGGTITVESEPAEGTTFTVTIPR